MKKLISTLTLSLLASIMFAQDVQRQSLKIGSSFPEETKGLQDMVKGRNGEAVANANGTLVIFTCNTCPYVLKSLPRMKEMVVYAQEHKLGLYIINSNEAQRNDADAPDAMKAFAATNNYPNYFIDKQSKVADIYGAGRTPEVFLFNKEGILEYKGAMDDNVSEPESAKEIFLRDAIDNMLTGKEISPKETKSIGCSIKRTK